jgi:hypothetical protein
MLGLNHTIYLLRALVPSVLTLPGGIASKEGRYNYTTKHQVYNRLASEKRNIKHTRTA